MDEGKRYIRRLYDSVIHDYSGSFSTKAGGYYIRKKMEVFLESFPDRKPSQLRLLEVGSADGVFTEQLARLGVEIYSVDISLPQLRKAKDRVPMIAGFVNADGEALPFKPESFDIIVSMCTVRYFTHPNQALRDWYVLLKPGGVLVVDVPNKYCPFFLGLNQLMNMLLRVPNPQRTAKYSVHSIRRVFTDGGFQEIKTTPILLVYRYFSDPLFYVAWTLEQMITRIPGMRHLLALIVCAGTRPNDRRAALHAQQEPRKAVEMKA